MKKEAMKESGEGYIERVGREERQWRNVVTKIQSLKTEFPRPHSQC